MATNKQRFEKYYNKKANLYYFKVGEYILQNTFSPSLEPNMGKLRPYQVVEITSKGPYKLDEIDGIPMKANWNVVRLKLFCLLGMQQFNFLLYACITNLFHFIFTDTLK